MVETSSISQPGSNDWYLDPSPWLSAMRHTSPVFYNEQGEVWHVLRYDDVELVLKHFSVFSSEFVGYGSSSKGEESSGTILSSMLTTDPPLHTKLRNIVSRSFTPSAIALLEPRIKEIADGLLGTIVPAKGTDMVADYAEPLPITVIAEMLGIPAEDRRKFKQWSDRIVGIAEGQQQPTQDFGENRTNLELGMYFGKIVEERRANPGDDLISSIVTSEVDGERLSLREAVSFCILLLVAGNETTTNLIGNAVRLFVRHGSFAKLREDSSLLPGAIEEVLRYSSPVRGMFRVAKTDTEISGRAVPAGQSLMAWIGSANRDEAKFSEPERFDTERKPNPHIAFGHGIHTCLGAPLARLEARVALGSLIKRFREIKLKVSDDEVEPLRNMVIGGVRHLTTELVQ